MKFVLAPDSFKESMTAAEAAAAMERGIRSVFPDAVCIVAPMADGGEGTADALVTALGGTLVTAEVQDALGRTVPATYGFVAAEGLAVVEIAAAAGIHLVAVADRDPRIASTFGVGRLIVDALDRGARRFIVGLGGSVTNDGGAGMLQALGARLLDVGGAELPRGGAALARLARIDLSGFDPRLADTSFRIACDVTNPLLGPSGASRVFGPQKGADESTVAELDAALGVFASVVTSMTGREVATVAGAGAAGGLGAAFLAFFDSTMQRGVDVVMEAAHLSESMAGADIVFTGEGSIDAQTLGGKTPLGVAETAARHGVPVIAFAGRVGEGAEALYGHGFAALVPIVLGVCTLAEALAAGAANLEKAVATTCRLLTVPQHSRP
ncbi:glycerate kinase [Cryobacterium sp. MDB1-18-2]|uniref:Glycerate kinase n=1 Tax=Cryobacterium glucosi TaxID=1259175 RepID=A0ABY2IJL0_9MICO|nr:MULTISPECIES: glycerate kinase [Cryobacterium]MEB0003417.1 glycerate kinase [Cryobacterium sp. RTC2.1]MEB0287800.1 glycerate kinase [Cryobacterium sp. 10S3]TFC18269.1 glycerate kinase [Cryobacterium glucosi]TFC24256.1 glycerate kinase [Cryobacterium sp. MDB1-18-2]TFC43306.1 glycerate kinase [Cryobacterium sp. MDB1-18-1]